MYEKVGDQTTLIDPALEKVGGQLTPLTPCFRGLCQAANWQVLRPIHYNTKPHYTSGLKHWSTGCTGPLQLLSTACNGFLGLAKIYK